MKLTTNVEIQKGFFEIKPTDRLLFVGSCFADNMGKRFSDNMFRTTVNPYGVMYNPASVLHTVERQAVEWGSGNGTCPDIAIFTLGTNHVYILNETGEIVDNCQKRPQRLFTERQLSVAECTDYLAKAIDILRGLNPYVRVILTVSPIRYAKYGFHGSQLSKATLLLATSELEQRYPDIVAYFPAYEIVNDELRDYRFYAPDMIHPSEQAVDYIYERFAETYFAASSHQFVREWAPIKTALSHRPFNPDSEEYKAFRAKAERDREEFLVKWSVGI